MKPRKLIAFISPSKRASRATYNQEARRVVAEAQALNVRCPVMNWCGVILPITCVHHMRGKNCEALRHDKRGWLLVSLTGHAWIDTNREEARRRGFLCPLGKWGTPFKPDEPPMPGSVAENNLLHP
jgi:hypothetical protein